MTSIRKRLAIYILLGMALLLAVAGVVVDHLVRDRLLEEFDRNLLAKAMTLVTLTDQEDGEVEFDFADQFMPEYSTRNEPEYFLLRLPDGEVLERSASLRDAMLPVTSPVTAEPRFSGLALANGRQVRAVSFAFTPRSDNDESAEPAADDHVDDRAASAGNRTVAPQVTDVTIVVARGREGLDQLTTSVRTMLSATFVVLMGLVTLLVHYSLRRGLLPLRRIAHDVGQLDARKLRTRLELPTDSEELLPIVNQLNLLLKRLEEAFQREQRFSGNVAHELRTPIAELRAMAEIGEKWPEDEKMVKMFFNDLVALANDMGKTVSNLLTIARLEADEQTIARETFNLRELAESTWRHMAMEARSRNISLDNRIDIDIRVTTDRDKLTLILNNLLSNAVVYSPVGSQITLDADKCGEEIQFAVANPVSELTQQDLRMMFDRFWRKDRARTGAQHAGLGLSVVKALVDILGLRVGPRLDEAGWLTMTVSGLKPA